MGNPTNWWGWSESGHTQVTGWWY